MLECHQLLLLLLLAVSAWCNNGIMQLLCRV